MDPKAKEKLIILVFMENFDSLFILDFFPLISILKNLINIWFTLITEVFGDSLNFV